jgi:acetyl-CoA carboxylase biotin carboxyl carrier protein
VPTAVATTPAVVAPQTETQPASTESKPTSSGNYLTIKSPMIGTFYRAPKPDAPNFVNVGDEIKPGQVVCIVEAMKLFNEIESEVAGRIVKVLVENASPVEYDQPLFLVEPL